MNEFAVLDINLTSTCEGIRIIITTNNPCHLTLYWTDKKPLRHPTERTIRGLTIPWGVYFCFVAWQAVEQNEPGDTLVHTFDLSPWAVCETRWFTFRGTVADVLSPSVGPIFERHLTIPPSTLIGSPAIDRNSRLGQRLLNIVIIESGNPTQFNGTICLVRVYTSEVRGAPLRIGTFYKTNTNQFSLRDAGDFWTPVLGYNEHPEELEIRVGDYIGVYLIRATYIEAALPGDTGIWFIESGTIDLDHTTCRWYPEYTMSLEGYQIY